MKLKREISKGMDAEKNIYIEGKRCQKKEETENSIIENEWVFGALNPSLPMITICSAGVLHLFG